jgi:hypothetical protein
VTALLLAALAASDASVALHSLGCPAGMEELVGAELGAAGFSLKPSDAPGQGVVARIEVSCAEGAMTVRVDDLVTDKRVERRISMAAGARADSRAAVQVVELLHASLAEARYRPAPVPQPVSRFLATKEPLALHARVGVVGGVLVAPGGFGVQPAVMASFSGFVGIVQVGGVFGATVHPRRFSGDFGFVEVGLLEARVTASLEVPWGRFFVHPRLGLGTLIAWAAGHAAPGYAANSLVAATFAASLGGLFEWPLTQGFSLIATADVAVTPFPLVLTLPQGGATMGLPTLSFGLGAAFR